MPHLRPLIIVFLCNVAWAAGVARAQLHAPSSRPATQPAYGDKRVDLPSFGVSFPVPDGFARSADNPDAIITLVPHGQVRQGEYDCWLAVTIQPLGDGSVERKLLSAAKKRDWRVRKWDGKEATESAALPDQTDRSGGRLWKIFLVRENYVICLTCGEDARHSGGQQAYETMVEGTKWEPFSHPAAGVAEGSLFLEKGGILFCIPDPFRMKEGSTRSFVARDLPSGEIVATLSLMFSPAPDRKDALSTTEDEVSQSLTLQYKLAAHFVWHDVPTAKGDMSLSDRVTIEHGWVQALVVIHPDHRRMAFTLEVSGADDAIAGMERVLPLIESTIGLPPKEKK